jgi:DnaK suppressor protein
MSSPTADQLEELRQDLIALSEELARLLASSREAARPVDLDQPIGRLSRMDAVQQQSMLAANRRAAQIRLQRAEAALQRLGAGEYGWCASCGEEIAYARLKAGPETPFCLGCQSQRERRA